ncbi:hypothetical protein [Alloactinosynnema sp. L-07]|nr:hypothetical protein [Alloactinosynnema sp. L-07]
MIALMWSWWSRIPGTRAHRQRRELIARLDAVGGYLATFHPVPPDAVAQALARTPRQEP